MAKQLKGDVLRFVAKEISVYGHIGMTPLLFRSTMMSQTVVGYCLAISSLHAYKMGKEEEWKGEAGKERREEKGDSRGLDGE